MADEENTEVRSGDNNHAVVLNNGIILTCGEIRRINRSFVRLKPFDPAKSADFTTTRKLRSMIRHNVIVFIRVEGDTLDVRGSQIVMIEDSQ